LLAPVDLTSFVGRERELAELGRLLAERRLVTLTGPGGGGKTRLALRLAAQRRAAFSVAWAVELGTFADPALVPAAVAAALGVVQPSGRSLPEALAAAIGSRRALLLLDNCEHLTAACAALVHGLLLACPRLRVAATSREPLGVPGEVVWPVPPLGLPPEPLLDAAGDPRAIAASEAGRLFLERATTACPDFVLTDENAAAVARICRRLDGLPLAIELAAARVRHLAPAQLADQLARATHGPSQVSPLPPLAAGARTLPPRHQTLTATIAWSESLLTPDERALLRRLSVFAGGFTPAAAGAVTEGLGARDQGLEETAPSSPQPPPDLFEAPSPSAALSRLVDKSLVVVRERGAAARYGMLETVRAYALDRLRAETPEAEDVLRARHARFFLGLVEEDEPRFFGPKRAATLAQLAPDLDNLRAALAWATPAGPPEDGERRPEIALRLASGLWWAWFHRGDWTEGRAWLDRALDLPPGGAGEADPQRAKALCGAGWLAFAQGDHAAACRRLTESVALHRRLRDGRGLALAAGFLSQVLLARGDPAEARRLAGESVALARVGGGAWDQAIARTNLGNVERARGNDVAAGRLYEESIAAARAAGDRWLEAMGLRNLGIVAARTGKHGRGVALLRESLALSREAGERWFVTRGLEELAGLTARAGDPARAARLLGAAEALRATVGAPVIPCHRERYEEAVAAVRAALPAETLAACWADGRKLSLDQAVAFALGEAPEAPVPVLNAVAGEALGRPNASPAARAGRPTLLRTGSGERADVPMTDPVLRISALGAGRVEVGGRLVTAADWTYAKPRELLFYLLDHPSRTKEQVGLALWPEASAEQLRGSFHVALHHLRRVLGDSGWVRYANRRYAFSRERPVWYDVAVFEDGLKDGRRAAEASGDPAPAIASLERTVSIYGGEYLEDQTGDWVEGRRDGLRRAFTDALLLLGELRLRSGQPVDAETTFRRLLAADELHEAAHRGVIRALARQGEPARALRHFEALIDLLQTELGAVPAAETADLADRLRVGEAI
jgi:predicted ATPase/DNA-binding SARP family transcriptional activator